MDEQILTEVLDYFKKDKEFRIVADFREIKDTETSKKTGDLEKELISFGDIRFIIAPKKQLNLEEISRLKNKLEFNSLNLIKNIDGERFEDFIQFPSLVYKDENGSNLRIDFYTSFEIARAIGLYSLKSIGNNPYRYLKSEIEKFN